MGATTVYDVKLQYGMEDRASAGLEHLAQRAGAADRATSSLKDTLMKVGAFVGGGMLLNEGKKAFVDYNAQLEQTRIALATITHMNLKGSFADAKLAADDLFRGLQEDAKRTPATTKELVTFASAIENSMLRAGMSMRDVRDLTTGSVVASKLFGIDSQMAALDIEQVLAGTLAKKDRFARALLEPLGYTTEQFNKLDAAKRVEALRAALTSPSIKAAQSEFESSFAGVTSTLKDNLEIAAGKVGLPLFKAITAEVGRWNEWIEKHPREIEEFSTKFAGALRDGFNAVRDVGRWLVENRETLLKLAEVWLLAKVVGGGGGGAGLLGGALGPGRGAGGDFDALGPLGKARAIGGSVLQSLGGMAVGGIAAAGVAQLNSKIAEVSPTFDTLNTATAGAAGALAGLPGPVGLVGAALLALHQGAQHVAQKFDERHRDLVVRGADLESFQRASKAAQGIGAWGALADVSGDADSRRKAFEAALPMLLKVREFAPDGDVNAGVLRAQTAALEASRDRWGQMNEEVGKEFGLAAWSALKVALAADPIRFQEFFGRAAGASAFAGATADARTGSRRVRDTNVNVTIQRIAVTSDDARRFTTNLIGAFKQYARNPTSARRSPRLGF